VEESSLHEVCGIVWMEIWPPEDLREIGEVVGAPYHIVMRGEICLSHMFEILWSVMEESTLRRTDRQLHEISCIMLHPSHAHVLPSFRTHFPLL
jgi:hypothetical protein